MRILFAFLFIISSLQLIGQNRLHVDHLTTEDGLSQNSVLSIVQDKKGFMWMGTEDGLNRYDGYKFTQFRHEANNPNSLPSGYVIDLCEDKEGYLWVLASQGDVARFNPATNRAETFRFQPKNEQNLSYSPSWCLHHNHLGQLWIGADNGLNLFLPETKSFKRFLYDSTHYRTQKGIQVLAIFTDAEGVLWVGTNRGLGKLDIKTGIFRKVQLIPNSKSEERIKTIYQDNNKTIWVGTATGGLFELLPDKKNFKSYTFNPKDISSISDNSVNGILEDNHHQLWVATGNGVNILNRQTGVFQRFYNVPGDKNSLKWNNITSIYKDKEGIIWFSGAGLERYNPRRKNVELFYQIPNDGNSLNAPSVFSLAEDETGNIWVAGGGIHVLNRKTGNFSHHVKHLTDANSLLNNSFIHLIFDEKGRLWGRTGRGIICFDKKTEKLTHYLHDTKNVNSLSANGGFSTICQDTVGRFWFGTNKGLNYFEEKTNRFTHYFTQPNDPTSISNNYISKIYKDGHNDVWVGTANGLNRWNRNTNTFTRFLANPKDHNSIINQLIYCITEDKNGNIWIGGPNGMSRYNPKTNQFQNYTVQSGLPNNVVYGIIPDEKNRLWISTNRGIAALNLTDNTFRYFGPSDGLQSWEFNGYSYFKSKKTGELFFGGVAGFNIFHPDSIGANPYIPPVYINSLRRYSGEGPSIKEIETENITNLQHVSFPHNVGQLTFEFVALSFSNPTKNQFTYQLKGYNDQWIPLGVKREVTFVGLPPGDYTLRVKASNGDGLWNDTPTELQISILPPWWRTWWAYLLYFGIFAFALNRYIRYRSNQLKSENIKLEEKVAQRTDELEQSLSDLKSTQIQLIQSQKQEALRMQELDEFKNRFFTNITHEFRTPLTVILGMSEHILSEGVTSSHPLTITQPIVLIKRNGENLLRLVNQILDLAKLESNTLKMNYIQGDILAYTRYIAESLHSLANAQNLMLRVESNQGQIVMDYDPERFLHIIHNLLSNAIKFTPSGGKVVLRLTVDDGQQTGSSTAKRQPSAMIRVTDTGPGIPLEEQPHIFERFFQAKNQDHTKAGGSGIGLSLTRELVKALGGEISVESMLGVGTTFFVKLPITNTGVFAEKETGSGARIVGVTPSHADNTMARSRSLADAPTVLLIEDNSDVVEYLIACLPDHYALDFAYNGQAGIEKALENIPDLIVSDVMMPLKDGFEVLDALKNDERTSHIPIILLTAKADAQSRMAGLRHGADAYLAKPFQQEELLVTIKNLLELRRKLQLKYQQNILASAIVVPAAPATDLEDAFLQEVRTIIATNYHDEDFGLPQLCQKVRMSRSQLFRKVKALMGFAPSDLIRLYRLNKAKMLLESGVANVSEAAWQVGFKYPSYFSKLYQEEFGEAPGVVRNYTCY